MNQAATTPIPTARSGWGVTGRTAQNDRMDRTEGLLAQYQGSDADDPAALPARTDRACRVWRRAKRQTGPRHCAWLLPRLSRTAHYRVRDHGSVRQPPGRHRSLAWCTRGHLRDMATTSRTRLVNPRLGTYFGI